MKKSLVLAMAMALGVTASAYAANPFSDVPAGHWAYDSLSKLAAAGVVEGYPDGSFKGENLMTRYEMAQIVAKAMAKGANVDALAAEFAEELDNLGVRVAALEKKADNVQITGEVRYLYQRDQAHDTNGDKAKGDSSTLRSRLWVNGKVNDAWSYTAMLQNEHEFRNATSEKDVDMKRAFVEGKIGGLEVKAGRYDAFFADGNVYDADADGVEVSYGDKVKLTAFAGKGTDAEVENMAGDDVETSFGKYVGAELSGNFGDFNAKAGYAKFRNMLKGGVVDNNGTPEANEGGLKNKIWYVGADYAFGDFTLNGMYLKGDKTYKGEKDNADKDGWTVGLALKGAEAEERGSWGLFANYYDMGGQAYIAHTTDAEQFDQDGFKGYGVGVNYAFAKNIVGTVAYYDTENKMDKKQDAKILWTDLTFTF